MTGPTGDVGLIGGGRWAKVIGSVLPGLLPHAARVVVTSPGNPAAWQAPGLPEGWQRAPSIKALLADAAISHVIIARRARDHAATVLEALAAGKAVMVEKPFCLTRAQADAIVAAARGRVCVTGLVFAHARNLHLFAQACAAQGAPREVHLVWADPAAEVRHNQAKHFDLSLNVVQDVMPHAWSVVHPLLGNRRLSPRRLRMTGGGGRVDLRIQADDCSLRLTLSRVHHRRVRLLRVLGDGWTAELDFATEPGRAAVNGAALDVSQGFESPLAAELRAFLTGQTLPVTEVAQAVQALDLSLDFMSRLRAAQARLLRRGLPVDPFALAALAEWVDGGIGFDGVPASGAEIAAFSGCRRDVIEAALGRLPLRGNQR